jgi:LacI family transcriptional regulator
VLIDRYIPMLPIDYVVSSDFEGGYSIAEHFINLGHKKIGYIREPEGVTSVEARFASFQKAMSDNCLAVNSKYTIYCFRSPQNPNPGEEYYSNVLKSLRELGDDLPTAFLCETDHMAIALYMAMMTLGKKIPEDVAIGGFGDSPMGAILPIPLTTVKQQQEQLGSKAVEVVIERDAGKNGEEPVQISLPTKLIVRNSCGSDIPDLTLKDKAEEKKALIKDVADRIQNRKNKDVIVS